MKRGGARFVHFATHALPDNFDPEQSGLLTAVDAGGAPVDGFVRVADIERTPLAAELVVLSACRTAIGKNFDGEGLVGLTRAFLRAGVPRVVSSLWQVDDGATAHLMAALVEDIAEASEPAAPMPTPVRWRQTEDAEDGRSARWQPVLGGMIDPADRKAASFARGGTYANEDQLHQSGQQNVLTKYYNDAEREAHKLGATDGQLTRADGTPMDTRDAAKSLGLSASPGHNIFALEHHADRGAAVYAADALGESYASQDAHAAGASPMAEMVASRDRALAAHAAGDAEVVDHLHHSSFTGGNAVDGAGDLEVKEGWLQRISNASGHYRPGVSSNLQTLRALERMGVNVDATTIENKTPNPLATDRNSEPKILTPGGWGPVHLPHHLE